MNIRKAFAKALKAARTAEGLTQEDFSEVSSRTYMSSLERALKSPTLDKIDELASVLNVHPATLIMIAYVYSSKGDSIEGLYAKIKHEAKIIIVNSICKCNSTSLVRGQAAIAYWASLSDQSLRSTQNAVHAAYPGTTISDLCPNESRS